MGKAPKMKALAIQGEYDCCYYSEEDDLSCGVMLKCSLGLETRWEKGHITYKIPKKCRLPDAPRKLVEAMRLLQNKKER